MISDASPTPPAGGALHQLTGQQLATLRGLWASPNGGVTFNGSVFTALPPEEPGGQGELPFNSRIRLTEDKTFTLEQLGGSPSVAWATLRDNYDLHGYRVRIQMPATHTGASTISGPLTGQHAPGDVEFYGGNPASFTVVDSTPGAILFYATNGARFAVVGMRLTCAGFGIVVSDGWVEASSIWWATHGQACLDVNGPTARIHCTGEHTWLSEPFTSACVAEGGGMISLACGVIISGAPHFSNAFVQADVGGIIDATSMVMSPGAASGDRFHALSGGIVFTGDGLASPFRFPGNAPGIVDQYSVYL